MNSVKHPAAGSVPGSGSAHRFARHVAPGDTVAPRELTTIRTERIQVPAPDALTHLQLRRYAGCPICNVHLRSVARRHDEIQAAGIREIVVFHSTVGDMLPYQGQLPFAAVADPDKELYAEFGVESSLRSVLHPRAWSNPLNPQAWSVAVGGIRAGAPLFSTGGQSILGLPADFLIAPDGRVLAVKYGRHANDQWSVDELLHLARTLSTGQREQRA